MYGLSIVKDELRRSLDAAKRSLFAVEQIWADLPLGLSEGIDIQRFQEIAVINLLALRLPAILDSAQGVIKQGDDSETRGKRLLAFLRRFVAEDPDLPTQQYEIDNHRAMDLLRELLWSRPAVFAQSTPNPQGKAFALVMAPDILWHPNTGSEFMDLLEANVAQSSVARVQIENYKGAWLWVYSEDLFHPLEHIKHIDRYFDAYDRTGNKEMLHIDRRMLANPIFRNFNGSTYSRTLEAPTAADRKLEHLSAEESPVRRDEIEQAEAYESLSALQSAEKWRPEQRFPEKGRREVFISYAWGDETPEGKIRMETVERLESALADDGFLPIRDRNKIRSGERISTFIERLTRADLVVAVISDKYLRSSYCMYEIYRIWQKYQGDLDILAQCLVPIVLPEVKIGDIEERAIYIKYWSARRSNLKALRRDLDLSLSSESWEEVRLVHEFAHHVDQVLFFLKDILMPRKLEAHIDNGFQAVRDALRRRIERDIHY